MEKLLSQRMGRHSPATALGPAASSSAENKFSMQILSGEPEEGPPSGSVRPLQGILMQAQVGKSLTGRKLLLREEGGEGAEPRQGRGRARISEPGGRS